MKDNKMNLQEATLKALSDQLQEQEDEVDGIVDDVLVVKDPDISSEDYNKLIDKANEIQEGTPERELPYQEDMINQYILRCPICGSAFLSKEVLTNEDECPICNEQPNEYIVVGKVASAKDEENEDTESKENTNNLEDNNEIKNNIDNEKHKEDIQKILIKTNR